MAAGALVSCPAVVWAETSDLWGVRGEAFDPTGRLMDWSYAGYRWGEQDLPDLPPTVDVTDFGATADDGSDDTSAFLAAIEDVATKGGVIHVPAGTFVLSERIALPSGVVLQGEGPATTTLEIPVSLTEVYGNDGLEGGGTSSYAFGGAFIEVRGDVDSEPLTAIVSNAPRGSRAIEVEQAKGLRVGAWIRITQTDVESGLMNRLHADLLSGGEDNLGDRGTNFHTRVEAIEGNTIRLERALPVDLDIAWAPDVRPVIATHEEVGVEHLRIAFPPTTYPGHFAEQGYNAIDLSEVMHSWVRDVEIVNADYGVNVRRSSFITVRDVVLSTTEDRGELGDGHHGLNNGHGSDNLFIGFDIRLGMVHDLTNEWYATGVVFTKGRGDDLRMDHHRAAPYSTLWTEIDCGAGEEPFVSGGRSDRGPHTAAYDTLWNVTANADMTLPEDDFGPRMAFVGFRTAATEVTSPYDWWLENIAPDALEPANLWEAMVQRRLDEEPGGSTGSGSESGGGGSDGSDGSAGSTTGGDDGAVPSGSEDGTAGPGAPQTTSATSTADTDPPGGADTDGGCGCRSGRSSSAPWLLLSLLGFWRRRRGGR